MNREFGYVVDFLTSRFLREICPEEFHPKKFKFKMDSAQIRDPYECTRHFRLQIENPFIEIKCSDRISLTTGNSSQYCSTIRMGDGKYAVEVEASVKYLPEKFAERFAALRSSNLKRTEKSMTGSGVMYYRLTLGEEGLYADNGNLIITIEDLSQIFNFERFYTL